MKNAALQYTYEDYLALPQTGPRHQLIEGDLLLSPSPTSPHQRIVRRLLGILSGFVESGSLGEVFCAPLDVVLSDVDVVQPDLLFVASAHRKRILRRGIQGSPDLVVEVLSEDRDMDVHVKRKLYARYGVPEYWVVDPDEETVLLYRLRERPARPTRTYASGDLLESPTFPGLKVPLREVFAR